MYQAAVIHGGVQLIGTGINVIFRPGEDLIQHKKALQLNETRLLQLGGDFENAVTLLDGHGIGLIAFVQGAQVIGQDPADTRQEHGAQHHGRHIDLPVKFPLAVLFLRSGGRCSLHLIDDPLMHRIGIPILGLETLIIIHNRMSFLRFICNMSRTSSIFPPWHIQYCTNR